MLVMAIDYGDAHTGVAFSGASGTLTGDAFVIDETSVPALIARLTELVRARGVTHVVLGHPKNMNGTLGPRAEKSRALSEALKTALDLPVALWDERQTTVDAHRILTQKNRRGAKRRQMIDAVAASLILENYLDFLRNRGEDTSQRT